MEGIKEFAIAYYERATEEEKKEAQEYFNKLDPNRDGKVSLLEFKNSVSSWLSSEKVFKQLDAKGKGTLGFNEVLAIYYMENRNLSLYCSGCRDLLLGQFFSCFLCLPKYPNSVDLCCDCYRKGKFKHEHSIRYFFDHHSLLRWFMYRRGKEERTQEKVNRRVNEERTQEKREMEELRKIAIAHFQAGSQQVQAKAQEFFNSMDSDSDGKIDLHEFLAFVSQEGLPQMHNPWFFKKLDRDGNGKLDFMEVMTLYYIIKSGRPFCKCCAKFVPGIFFSCVDCSFTLCRHCYQSTKCDHNHNGRTQFLDNYTLLQVKLKQDSSLAIRINSNKVHHPNPSHGTVSTAIVPARKVNKWDVTLKAFEVALAIANISATMCTIL